MRERRWKKLKYSGKKKKQTLNTSGNKTKNILKNSGEKKEKLLSESGGKKEKLLQRAVENWWCAAKNWLKNQRHGGGRSVLLPEHH